MTAGEDVGKKSVIDVKTIDKIEGIIVQDVKQGEGQPVLRQVIFETKSDQIQSEIRLVYRDPKKHDIPDSQLATSELQPKKKGKKSVYTFDWLNCGYQAGILAGLFMVPKLADHKLKILHLGTGAGTLPMFLISQLGEQIEQLVTVDIDKDILLIAKKYFGFNPDG